MVNGGESTTMMTGIRWSNESLSAGMFVGEELR
jgi:hypothetical protein